LSTFRIRSMVGKQFKHIGECNHWVFESLDNGKKFGQIVEIRVVSVKTDFL
jgi:hypothetical protein